MVRAAGGPVNPQRRNPGLHAGKARGKPDRHLQSRASGLAALADWLSRPGEKLNQGMQGLAEGPQSLNQGGWTRAASLSASMLVR